jgi:hypothetical protein
MSAALADKAEELFSDRRWRLNNLYKIKDKAGNAVDFRLNPAQEKLLDQLWSLNLILKARQMGFTTLIQILMLDACLFNSNTSAGIVAHTREDAEAFFDDKIKFAYDHLDPEIRKVVSATQDSAKSLTFSNGSRIRVGTSLRSGTFQYLHVSEFGKICASYPDKAKEIVTGAFNTVQAGQFIAVESTAEGQGGKFHDMVMAAKKHAEMQKPLTSLDFKLHFFPWWQDASYALSDAETAMVTLTEEDEEYFNRLDDNGIELTENQEAWYVKKRDQQGDGMGREYPSTVEEAFEASIEGAYFAKEMERVRREGRISQLPLENLPVDTFWDLASTTTWFSGFASASGRSIASSAIMPIRARGCFTTPASWTRWPVSVAGSTARTTFPTTARCAASPMRRRPWSRCWSSSTSSRSSSCRASSTRKQGIEASRAYLPRCWFDEKYCAEGIRAIDNYRKEWDEERAVWKDRARHDWASHGYKAFETASVALEQLEDEEEQPDFGDDGRSDIGGY